MALTVNTFYSDCPDGCDDVLLLPAITEDQDCTDYEQEYSQISDLFIEPNEMATDIFAAFATTPTYTAGNVDNTVTDNSKGKWLVGIGELTTTNKSTLDYPKQKTKTVSRDYQLTFKVPNLSSTNYKFLQALQCGSTKFTFYFADVANWLYGKQGGIIPASVDVDFVTGAGNEDRKFANLILTFKAKGDPDRRINPFVAP